MSTILERIWYISKGSYVLWIKDIPCDAFDLRFELYKKQEKEKWVIIRVLKGKGDDPSVDGKE